MSRLHRNPAGSARSILDEIKMEVESHTQPGPSSNSNTTTKDDDLYEEELTLFADFDICLEVDDPNLHIKVIGIDTEHPVIQVNDEVYRGTVDFAFGTNVFFEKDPKATASLDPVFENNIKDLYRYVCSTDKVLHMKRIFVNAKDQQNQGQPATAAVGSEGDSSGDESPDTGKYEINMTYEDALNMHLQEGCVASRHIAENLNGASLMQNRRIKGEPMMQDD
uniref:Transcription factor TFIIIC triple barrel domain-containing protein n=1 Tax=Anopheles maculatus TaxID=74869 RepID=A0A182SLY2_9DIPT